MTLRDALHAVVDGKQLSRAEIAGAFGEILSGQAAPTQIAAFLIALRMRGETAEEIAGAADSMRQHADWLPTSSGQLGDANVSDTRSEPGGRRTTASQASGGGEVPHNLIDTCGTGGDGSHTFNVSTATAIVAAGAGARVAKHGNRAVSSRCGSADVLAALGVNINAPKKTVARCLEKHGIAFLFAPRHHPAMRFVAPIRADLGLRTIFNVIGPLANPAGVKRQVLGVYSQELVGVVAGALAELGAERAFVVHGAGGLDEISPFGPTQIAEVRDGKVARRFDFDPREAGFEYAKPGDIDGGDVAMNASLMEAILDGAKGPRRNSVALNAGAALAAAGLCETIAEGVRLAEAAIDDGRARAKLEAWVAGTIPQPGDEAA